MRHRNSIEAKMCAWLAAAGGLLALQPSVLGQVLGVQARQQIAALQQEKAQRPAVLNKLDSQIVFALRESQNRKASDGAPDLRADVRFEPDGRLLVDITASVTPDALARIAELGGEVVSSFPEYDAVRARLPLAAVPQIAALPAVRFIAPAEVPTTNTGSVDSEGDACHRADRARAIFNTDGTGINIGVLSDSVDFLAGSQGSGDLPATVTVLAGQSGTPATGEGTAMLEIVHDIAPGASLFFATGFGSQAGMAANITALQAAGCQIIVDDVTYFSESPFQDAVIAQAVNTVSGQGVLYFSSARNSGNQNDGTSSTWEGDFADGGAVSSPISGSGHLHDFGGGTTFNTVAAGGNNRRVDLFWADALGASNNDYDLFVLDSTGANVLRSSMNAQTGSQNPYESVSTLNVGERVVIVRQSGAGRFLHLDVGRGRLTRSTAGCVRGHNASGAANAFSVAATDVANSTPNPFAGGATNPVEGFSSDGPRRMFFDPSGNAYTPGNFSSTGGIVLQKPDITAADGVVTATPGFNPFFGTSASAPHAAAIASLLWSWDTGLSPAEIRTAMQSTALDIEAAGFDRDSGFGIVDVVQALESLDPCTVTCPANIEVGNDPGYCGATVNFTAPTTSGGCGNVTSVPASGSFFAVGTTTVTSTSESKDFCTFTVKVNDTEDPVITCPGDITQGTDPGLCSAVVSFTVTATDNCSGVGTVTSIPASGSVFAKGTTTVTSTVSDAAGNSSQCSFDVTVEDREPPVVTCSVRLPSLWPPDHSLVDVGLTASATDNCGGTLPITVKVFGDEDDEENTGDGRFSPDAKNVDLGTLRLRQERKGNADGRVYLILVEATDTSGNVGRNVCTVVIPLDRTQSALNRVNFQATTAKAACLAGNGARPTGYFVVGDGVVQGPIQ